MTSLTPPQDTALIKMREKFADVYSPSKDSKVFAVDDLCLLRYLRARNYDVNKAADMLHKTLSWRKSFGLDEMSTTWRPIIEKENSTGKMYARGFDKEGHALLYMKPSKENTNEFDGNMKHLVFNIEMAVRNMLEAGRGTEKLVLLVDYENWSLSNSPPLKTSKETLNILQNHYPERLHKAVCINPPWVFSIFMGAVGPFIDPITKAKILLLNNPPDVCKQKLLGSSIVEM
jgi:hypothetical protein